MQNVFVSTDQRKISEILQEAQNLIGEGKERFICYAITRTMNLSEKVNLSELPAVQFLKECGMPLDGGGFMRYKDRSFLLMPETRQALRYAWLELAIQIAEEEGL